MNPVVMVAIRQLTGDWGTAASNGLFETSEDMALELEARGLAYRWRPPVVAIAAKVKATHANKMMQPAENK